MLIKIQLCLISHQLNIHWLYPRTTNVLIKPHLNIRFEKLQYCLEKRMKKIFFCRQINCIRREHLKEGINVHIILCVYLIKDYCTGVLRISSTSVNTQWQFVFQYFEGLAGDTIWYRLSVPMLNLYLIGLHKLETFTLVK